MWLIVGLGNPGYEYAWTPHNLGFHAVDALANRLDSTPMEPLSRPRLIDRIRRPTLLERVRRRNLGSWQRHGQSEVRLGEIAGHEVMLAKPLTYMNASGIAVSYLLKQEQLSSENLIVVLDDFALPWGHLRVRIRGSAGGHNGLRSVIQIIGSTEFIRIRLGVQPDNPLIDLGSYVLSPMYGSYLEFAKREAVLGADAVETVVKDGSQRAMSRFNNKVWDWGNL